MIQIYNTLTKKIGPLQTLESGKVKLYVCGVTVYDYCHMGHARVYVVFDTIVRYLRQQGYEVTYIRNITDVDDKILSRAKENQEDFHTLTHRFTEAMHHDFAALGILPPEAEPKATHYIEKIITLIETLLKRGYAYIAANGDIYYRVKTFADYGKLSQQNLEKLQAGARISVTEAKADPLDFVLWKRAKTDEFGWPSPWSNGRPGWHIECSAMAMDCLGEQIDIHGGGLDLIFPHHQNEIAQSEGATEKPFVHQWMHVGFVTINREKMSKSLGNFFTIREVLEKYTGEVIRYYLLTSHYRRPLQYTTERLDSAQAALARLYLTLRDIPLLSTTDLIENAFSQRFHCAMQEDFNTPEALAVLFDLAREINRLSDNNIAQASHYATQLKQLGHILGVLQTDPNVFFQTVSTHEESAKINALIAERNIAREQKAWEKADSIRQVLSEMRIIIEDTVQGTLWRKE